MKYLIGCLVLIASTSAFAQCFPNNSADYETYSQSQQPSQQMTRALSCKILSCGGTSHGGGCQYLGYVEPQLSKSYTIKTKDGFKASIRYESINTLSISIEDLKTGKKDSNQGNPTELEVNVDRSYRNDVVRGWGIECSAEIPNDPSSNPDLTKAKSPFMNLMESSL